MSPRPSRVTARLAARIATAAVARLPLAKAATLSEDARFSLAAEIAAQLCATPAFRQLAAAHASLPALRKQVKGMEARFGNLEGSSSSSVTWRDRFTHSSGPHGLIPLTPGDFRVALTRQDPPRPAAGSTYALRPEEAS
jgi:hypothetical protein